MGWCEHSNPTCKACLNDRIYTLGKLLEAEIKRSVRAELALREVCNTHPSECNCYGCETYAKIAADNLRALDAALKEC